MIRREEGDFMNVHKSPQNSKYSSSFIGNICVPLPDDALLSVIDRLFLPPIMEGHENSYSEYEISVSGADAKLDSSMVSAAIKEVISEIENDRASSEGSASQKNSSKKKGSRHQSSDLKTKKSGVNTYVNNKSNSKCLSQDPILSISITPKEKGATPRNNKCSDDFDGDRESTYQEIFNESRITGSNMEELSKLTKDSKKSSHVPFTNQCISKETEREHSKRTNSTIPDGTQSVFINTLPSYRSQKPTYPWTSSGSSINSASSNFHSGNSTGCFESTAPKNSSLNSKKTKKRPTSSMTSNYIKNGVSSKNSTQKSSSSSKKTEEEPKSIITSKDIKNGVSAKTMKTITNEEHLKSRNSTPKCISIDSIHSRRTKTNSQPSDTDERSEFMSSKSLNLLSQKSETQSRPQTESIVSRPQKSRQSNSKSFNGLNVLKMSSALQEDSPNDFQYLPMESSAYKSSLNPHQKVDGIPSQTPKAVLFSAKKMHCGDRGRSKILKQEWATTRIITYADSSKTFEVMEPKKFREFDIIDVNHLTATVFAVLPNKTTVCYVRERSESIH